MPFENALFPLTRIFSEPVTPLLFACGVMVPGALGVEWACRRQQPGAVRQAPGALRRYSRAAPMPGLARGLRSAAKGA